MSYPGAFNTIKAADSPSVDAFSRWRTSDPKLRLSAVFDTDKRPLFWDESTTGTGAATHLPNEQSVQLQVTSSGDEVIRQTRERFVYRAGQSVLVFSTFVLAALEANLLQEIGYGDADDGIFIQADGTTINIVRRTSTSGSPVDTDVAQASWNIDAFDGSGPSGKTIDWTKVQILVIDLQWLGAGRVRVGFDIDGQIMYAHQFIAANTLSKVYMKTAKLPVRYRIDATGAIGGATSMTQICSAVIREGGADEPSVQREVDSGTTSVTLSTAWETVIGVRLKAANIDATLRNVAASLLNLDASISVQFGVIVNPAGTGGASWTDVAQDAAITQYSRTNAAITVDGSGDPSSGIVLPVGGFTPAAAAGRGGVASTRITELLAITADLAGTPDEVWLIARGVSGTPAVRGILSYQEER
jgi:hypothetical protein